MNKKLNTNLIPLHNQTHINVLLTEAARYLNIATHDINMA